jgi:hypothetical protein
LLCGINLAGQALKPRYISYLVMYRGKRPLRARFVIYWV